MMDLIHIVLKCYSVSEEMCQAEMKESEMRRKERGERKREESSGGRKREKSGGEEFESEEREDEDDEEKSEDYEDESSEEEEDEEEIKQERAWEIFSSCKIKDLRKFSLPSSCFDHIYSASPSDSIAHLCSVLFQHQLSGVPLLDGSTALSFVTSFQIFQFFASNLPR